MLDHVQQPIEMSLVFGREHDQQNPGAFPCHPRVVQTLTYRLRPFPRKVHLDSVAVQNAVHTGPVGEPDLGPPVLRFAPLALIMGLRLLRKT